MNKKWNTVLFLIGATVLNLLILVVLLALLGSIFILIYRNVDEVSMGLSWLAIIIIMFGSIAGTFFLYSRIIKYIVKKWKLENYIEPLFKSARRRR